MQEQKADGAGVPPLRTEQLENLKNTQRSQRTGDSGDAKKGNTTDRNKPTPKMSMGPEYGQAEQESASARQRRDRKARSKDQLAERRPQSSGAASESQRVGIQVGRRSRGQRQRSQAGATIDAQEKQGSERLNTFQQLINERISQRSAGKEGEEATPQLRGSEFSGSRGPHEEEVAATNEEWEAVDRKEAPGLSPELSSLDPTPQQTPICTPSNMNLAANGRKKMTAFEKVYGSKSAASRYLKGPAGPVLKKSRPTVDTGKLGSPGPARKSPNKPYDPMTLPL